MAKLEQHQKVFGLGLSRTGTTSLAKALNILGIKTIHFPNDQATYNELRKGTYRLSILERYQGVTDIPVVPYYAQLDKIYPGSKFILTVREIGSWLESIESHWRLWVERPPRKEFTDFVVACVYGTLGFNEDRFRYVYDTYFRNVCGYFANRPRDFLVMNIVDGDSWEKLCPFLGLPIPDVPFPYLNKGVENQKWMRSLDLTIQDISALIPAGNAFILVDNAKFGGEVVTGRRTIPFLERDGQYCGPPPDGITAIREIERLRRSGASFIVFAWTAFWWLDHYAGLSEHLRSNYRCALENDRLVVFDLRLYNRGRMSWQG
jgi:hypothetical protein